MMLGLITECAVFVEFDDDTGSMSDNLELSDQYRMDALEFLRHSLGLSDSTWDPNKPVNPVVKSFEIVGVPVREAYNHGKCDIGL